MLTSSLLVTLLSSLSHAFSICCLSNSFIPYSVKLCDSPHPFQHSHFQLLLLGFLRCRCLGPIHHCFLLHSCILSIDLQGDSSFTQNPQTRLLLVSYSLYYHCCASTDRYPEPHQQMTHKAQESYICTSTHKSYFLSSGDYLLFVLYLPEVPTYAMRLVHRYMCSDAM